MTYDYTTPEDVLRTIKDHKIQIISAVHRPTRAVATFVGAAERPRLRKLRRRGLLRRIFDGLVPGDPGK